MAPKHHIPTCYEQGPCDKGYMDFTGGKTDRWTCANTCQGGKFIATASCSCACIMATPCQPRINAINEAAKDLAKEHFKFSKGAEKQVSPVKKFGACEVIEGMEGKRATCVKEAPCCAQVQLGNLGSGKTVHMCLEKHTKFFGGDERGVV